MDCRNEGLLEAILEASHDINSLQTRVFYVHTVSTAISQLRVFHTKYDTIFYPFLYSIDVNVLAGESKLPLIHLILS